MLPWAGARRLCSGIVADDGSFRKRTTDPIVYAPAIHQASRAHRSCVYTSVDCQLPPPAWRFLPSSRTPRPAPRPLVATDADDGIAAPGRRRIRCCVAERLHWNIRCAYQPTANCTAPDTRPTCVLNYGYFYQCLFYPGWQDQCFQFGKETFLPLETLKSVEMTSLQFKSSRKEVLRLLECPVCLEKMTSPIHVCANGHSTCGNCRRRLARCGMCKARIIVARNIALEQLVDDIELQEEPVILEGSGDRYECLAGKHAGCSWTGSRQDVLAHVRTQHKHLFAPMPQDHKTFYWHEETTPAYSCRLVFCQGQLFWLHVSFDHGGGRAYAALQYVGNSEYAHTYSYKYKFFSPLAVEKTTFTCVAHSCAKNIPFVFARQDCACLDYVSLQKYIHNGLITTSLKIKRKQSQAPP